MVVTMPIPQDHDQWHLKNYLVDEQPPQAFEAISMREMWEESIRTEDCEGPIPDIAMEDASEEQEKGIRPENEGEILCSDRAELMERIKRGESPTWVPNQAVSWVRTG